MKSSDQDPPASSYKDALVSVRVTLAYFIYIQNTFALSHRCSDSLSLTSTHHNAGWHIRTQIPKTLTPSRGAGGWGIATTHFASMQPPSRQRWDVQGEEGYRWEEGNPQHIGGRRERGLWKCKKKRRKVKEMAQRNPLWSCAWVLRRSALRVYGELRLRAKHWDAFIRRHIQREWQRGRVGGDREKDALASHDLLFFSTLTWLPGKPG